MPPSSTKQIHEGKSTKRIQRRRAKGWRMPPNTIYVGRGSRWGNPFRLVQYSNGKWAIKTDGSDKCTEILTRHCRAVYDTKAEAAADAVRCYGYWLVPYRHGGGIIEFCQSMAVVDDAIAALRGKNLACWCRLDENCHADLLLELANS